MKCQLCKIDFYNAPMRMRCTKYRVCFDCIDSLVAKEIKGGK